LNHVYLGLGSNLDNPLQQLRNAIKAIDAIHECTVLKTASFYVSSPQGPQDQPDYINTVCLIETSLEPLELLNQTQKIEQDFGRVKTRHWGERSIDIDLLLFDQIIFSNMRLTIPHASMFERDFVLQPLLEIAPEISIPMKGPVKLCLSRVKEKYVQSIIDYDAMDE
jgi:2-amino-4-hydroxy-6-hydroxymethyldihydropteridine diphosphokinase